MFFMNSHGQMFKIIRSGNEIGSLKGVQNQSKGKKIVQFEPGTDVQVDDRLISEVTGEEYIVVNTDTSTFKGRPHSKNAFYLTLTEYQERQSKQLKQPQSVTFNIESVQGSIVGTNPSGVINYGITDLEKLIQSKSQPTEDFSELLKVIKDSLAGDNVSKGFLSKFDEQINKHSWLAGPIAQILINFCLGKQQ